MLPSVKLTLNAGLGKGIGNAYTMGNQLEARHAGTQLLADEGLKISRIATRVITQLLADEGLKIPRIATRLINEIVNTFM